MDLFGKPANGVSEVVVVGLAQQAGGGIGGDAAQPVLEKRLGGDEVGGQGGGEQVDGAQVAVGGAHEVFGVEIGDEPRGVIHEKKTRVVAVGAEQAGRDGDQRGGLDAGGIGPFGQLLAEGSVW